jgi:hypothetical protein
MPDIADFHPLMQAALRTGTLPSDEQIADAVGETPGNISRLRADLDAEAPDALRDMSAPDSADADEERYRRRYRELVDAMIEQWHDDNPHAGNSIPNSERQRIEDYCRNQIQHQWKMHRQRLTNGHDA